MANLTSVGITSGVPTSGSGTVSTIDALMADGGQATLGSKADAASTATDTTAVTHTSILKQISKSIQAAAASLAGTLTVATHAVTQSGSWVLSAGSALIGKVGIDQTTPGTTNGVVVNAALPAGTNLIGSAKISDGTTVLPILAASSGAPAATVPAIPVSIRDVNGNGQATMGGSSPVVIASDQSPIKMADQYGAYETIAASQTAQAMGATGATGDYLAGVLIIPATTGAGAVSIADGSGSAITIFAGGGTTALADLRPFLVPLGLFSTSGAWKITTGANVTAVGIGKFT